MSSMSNMSSVSKLPALTVAFWIMKVSATTLGETVGDLFSMTWQLGYAASTVLWLALFAVAIVGQLVVTRYVPPLYWFVILTTSTAGTTLSDFMDRTLGLGYALGSAALATTLALVLGAWRASEGSLSVGELRSRRAELFYWLAILVSNTLGTAVGDFLADDSGLGFAGGALLIAGAIAVVVAMFLVTRVSRVGLFWCAFVLTRPLGATVGDLLTKGQEAGGLGLGTVGASLVLGAVLLSLVAGDWWRSSRQPRSRQR